VLTTPQCSAEAEVTQRDAWGNTRVAGRGRPPFRGELVDGDGEGVPRTTVQRRATASPRAAVLRAYMSTSAACSSPAKSSPSRG
jgi:hypothetical protein